jgi:hypothetical protein
MTRPLKLIEAERQRRYDRALELVRKPLPLEPYDHAELKGLLPLLSVHQIQMLVNEQTAAHPVLRQ